jgi:dephospho-CoA kinase
MVGMKLVGVAGTNGSGKDTVGHILAEKHGWLFVSVTDMLRDECRARGLEVARENLRMISAEWRREGGLGVLIDKAIAVYDGRRGENAYKGLVVASLRNPGEADRIHELGGTVVWVDADPRLRYERIQSSNRGRGSEDSKTFEEFLAEQEAEMHSSGDEATLNLAGVKALADTEIFNESDLTTLESAVADLLI